MLFILGSIACVIIWEMKFRNPTPTYRSRSFQGKGWRHAFPDASKSDVREFLTAFVSSFAFRETEQLDLSPTDTLTAAYRKLRPSRTWPDAAETEALARDMRRQIGVELDTNWTHGMTLGTVFGQALQNKKESPAVRRELTGG
ncbi:hypothetical protein D3872_06070 [Massilia cavernae]|uniref:Uncharacterized protein n=2 Tax=Massilia cavernae TaxID=2320864 RepID=A0A418Y5P8_9BURK|nr:hypothetical protein D3872_06070 [Massilia cavernae]